MNEEKINYDFNKIEVSFTGIDCNGRVWLKGYPVVQLNIFKAREIELPEQHIIENYKTELSYKFLFYPKTYKKVVDYPHVNVVT